MPTVRDDLVMTPAEVAEALRCDPDTVREWLREGYIDGTKVGTRWKVSRRAIFTEDGSVRPDIGPPNN